MFEDVDRLWTSHQGGSSNIRRLINPPDLEAEVSAVTLLTGLSRVTVKRSLVGHFLDLPSIKCEYLLYIGYMNARKNALSAGVDA